MTTQKGYGSHDTKDAKDDDRPEAAQMPADTAWHPPAKLPTQDAWRLVQGALNSCRLADPPLVVDGIPGPLTQKAAEGLVPLIKYVRAKTPSAAPA